MKEEVKLSPFLLPGVCPEARLVRVQVRMIPEH